MNHSELVHRIEVQLVELKMSRSKLAKLLKMSLQHRSSLSQRMNGAVRFSVSELVYIFKILRFSDEQILKLMKI